MVIDDLRVGDEKTIVIATTVASGDNAGDAKNPVSATFLGLDPDHQTTGTADSGSTTTLVDTDRTEDNSFWVGVTIRVTDATDGKQYRSEVTAFVKVTGTLTFNALPITVVAGDTYELEGYPLLTQQAASAISANEGSIQLTPSDMLGTPGRRVLVYRPDFGTDAEEVVCSFRVLPSLLT